MVAEASVVAREVQALPMEIRDPSALLRGAPERISFGALAHHYSDLLGQTLSDLRLIAELGTVIYLIDADVVRNLVERRYRDQRVRHEAIRLFEDPTFEYALPVGAFHEIVEWIRNFSSGHIQFAEARAFQKRLSRFELIKELARLCNVPFSEGDKEENIVRRFVESVGEKNAVISRLLAFLSNPRFHGVISDYRIDGVSKCFRVIRAHGSESERAGRDLQDAINLSIVFDSARQERLNPEWDSPCFVLITETRLLLNLASGPIDNDIAQDLATLNGLSGPFSPNLLPVLTPRRAFMVEQVRQLYPTNEVAEKRVQAERAIYDQLGDALRANRGRNTQALNETLRRSFLHLHRVYYGEEVFFRSLERERATVDSIRLLEAKHRTKRGDEVGAEDLQVATHSLFRLLYQFHQLASQITPTEYVATAEEDDDNQDIYHLSIASHHPEETLVEGQLFKIGGSPRAYSLRWITGCSEKDFFSAVSGFLLRPVGASQPSNPPLTLRSIEHDSPEWLEGVVVFTSGGVFGTTLSQYSIQLLLESLSLELILDALELCLEELAVTDPSSKLLQKVALWRTNHPSGTTARLSVDVRAIRITTGFGHFQIDILDPEATERHVSVISHRNISRQISHLCEHTSMYPILSNKFNQALQDLIGDFEAADHA